MADICPKCGEVLITRTIQKKLGLGSIDYPVAQICPKCNWSRDLTGAGDIVAKPPVIEDSGVKHEKKPEAARQAPEKPKPVPEKAGPVPEKTEHPPARTPAQTPPDVNRYITIALAVIVIAAIFWALLPRGGEQTSSSQTGLTPVATPAIIAASTPVPEVTTTGNNITVKIERDRGFIIPAQRNIKIKPGDGIIWLNDGTYPFTIVSNDGLFEDKLLENDKIKPYVFKKPGTYTFDILVMGIKKFNGTVVVQP